MEFAPNTGCPRCSEPLPVTAPRGAVCERCARRVAINAMLQRIARAIAIRSLALASVRIAQ